MDTEGKTDKEVRLRYRRSNLLSLFLFRDFLQKSRISKQASQPALLSGFSFLTNDLPSEACAVYQISKEMSRNGNPARTRLRYNCKNDKSILTGDHSFTIIGEREVTYCVWWRLKANDMKEKRESKSSRVA